MRHVVDRTVLPDFNLSRRKLFPKHLFAFLQKVSEPDVIKHHVLVSFFIVVGDSNTFWIDSIRIDVYLFLSKCFDRSFLIIPLFEILYQRFSSCIRSFYNLIVLFDLIPLFFLSFYPSILFFNHLSMSFIRFLLPLIAQKLLFQLIHQSFSSESGQGRHAFVCRYLIDRE